MRPFALGSSTPSGVPFPLRAWDMPAMGIVLDGPPARGRPSGIVLCEAPDGTPRAADVRILDGVATVGTTNAPYGLGCAWAAYWLSDGPGGVLSRVARGDMATQAPGTGSGTAREILHECGFTPAFRHFLEAAALLPPSLQTGDGLNGLMGHDPRAAAKRAFVIDHPALSCLLAERFGEAFGEGAMPDVRNVEPSLSDAAIRALSGKAWVAWVREVRPPLGALSQTVRFHPGAALHLLATMPRDWIPSTRDGILAFCEASTLLSFYLSFDLDAAVLCASSKGDWRAFVERCVGTGRGLEWKPDGYGYSAYLADPARHLAERVVQPLMALADPDVPLRLAGRTPEEYEHMVAAARHAGRLLYGGRSLPAVIEKAKEWHGALSRIEAAMPSDADAPGMSWPALLPDGEVDGIVLKVLTDAEALRDEGAKVPDRHGSPGLDHCVGSYRSKVAAGESHVISLRRMLPGGGYERLSTAEVTQGLDGSLSVAQHSGRRNAVPPEGCREALAAFLPRRLPYLPPRERERFDPVSEDCGYDWRDPALVDQACRAYAPVLARDLRGGAGPIMARMGLDVPALRDAPRP